MGTDYREGDVVIKEGRRGFVRVGTKKTEKAKASLAPSPPGGFGGFCNH